MGADSSGEIRICQGKLAKNASLVGHFSIFNP
jgi:hypothetical protein